MTISTNRIGTRACAPAKLADGAYAQLKQDIFDFQLVPGDRFSEAEVAERLGISRTPVREALFRLQREGYLDVTARSGWVGNMRRCRSRRNFLQATRRAKSCSRAPMARRSITGTLRGAIVAVCPTIRGRACGTVRASSYADSAA